jgi:hypothetical protein
LQNGGCRPSKKDAVLAVEQHKSSVASPAKYAIENTKNQVAEIATLIVSSPASPQAKRRDFV